ncbi:MAG: lantibiotic dehydratase [Clostridiales bacterium]|nr:lantibiotic dehydratase [Clostridiales bacterium]
MAFEFKCLDWFFFRTTLYPVSAMKDRFSAIYDDDFQKSFDDKIIKELLCTSSSPLYQALFDNQFKIEEKQRESVLKYLLRCCSRTTPFGELAGVGEGGFSSSPQRTVSAENTHRLFRPDMQWVYAITEELEKHAGENLVLYINNATVIKGSIWTNRWKSCFYKVDDTVEPKRSMTINKPLRLLLQICENGGSIRQIQDDLFKEYAIEKTETAKLIYDLMRYEFLISEYRNNIFSINHIERLLSVYYSRMSHEDTQFVETEKRLISIKKGIEKLNATSIGEGTEIYLDILKEMSQMSESPAYLTQDLFFQNITLPPHIKRDVEGFCRFMSNLSERNRELATYTNLFLDRWIDSYISLTDFFEDIDVLSNQGDGLIINRQTTQSVEKLVQYVFSHFNDEEINLADFTEFDDIDTNNVDVKFSDFELAVHLFLKDNEINYLLPAFYGSRDNYKAFGKYFYHANLLDKSKIDKTKTDAARDEIVVDIAVNAKNRAHTNVLQGTVNADYFLAYGGFPTGASNEIDINDIYLTVHKGQFVFFSKKLQRRIRFVQRSLFNPLLYPPIVRLLLTLSNTGLLVFAERIITMSGNYPEIPRVVYKKFVISPKRWTVYLIDMQEKKYPITVEGLKSYLDFRKIPKEVLWHTTQGYLYIDLTRDLELKLLIKELTKEKRLNLSESLQTMYPSYITDENQNTRFSDVVFQIKAGNTPPKNSGEEPKFDPRKIMTPELRRRNTFAPFDRWLYFKIYTKRNYMESIMSEYIYPVYTKMVNAGYIDSYFFIRYLDSNDHIRLRVKTPPDKMEAVLIQTQRMVAQMITNTRVSSIAIDTYEREVMRYGGEECMDIMEELFYHDTAAAIKLLLAEKKFLPAISKLDIHILSITSLIWDLRLSNKVMDGFFNMVVPKAKTTKEFRDKKNTFLDWVRAYAKNAELPQDTQELGRIFRERNAAYSKVFAELIDMGKSDADLSDILSALIHMNNNRYCGINSQSETQAYTFVALLFKAIRNMKGDAAIR